LRWINGLESGDDLAGFDKRGNAGFDGGDPDGVPFQSSSVGDYSGRRDTPRPPRSGPTKYPMKTR
jgi:hypothetical protein